MRWRWAAYAVTLHAGAYLTGRALGWAIGHVDQAIARAYPRTTR